MDANTLTAFASSALNAELDGISNALKAMPEKDVQQASEFLDVILDRIVCKQILPRLLSRFEAALNLNFTFILSSQLDSASTASVQLDVDVTHKLGGDWNPRVYVYGQQVHAWEPSVRLEQTRLLVYAKSQLLANLFSSYFTSFTVKLDFLVLKTQFAGFYGPADIGIPLRLKPQTCFTSMLENLISDGYDLTDLQPFITSIK